VSLPDRPMPVQSAHDSAAPDVDYMAVIAELRRLRDQAHETSKNPSNLRCHSYHDGRFVAYAKALRLLSGEDQPEQSNTVKT